ncbi:MAG: Wzt carbohydrate-binding domain-containing protein, partial [Candidatus Kuenenia stuttgartiensis]|nr:Wzt carbohydrate-binding domain-containing protein [Candidatus Kuenenia stuttgartiensis]
KMGEVAQGGRTVLFVSHNMDAVQKICNQCMLMKSGVIQSSGETLPIVSSYLKNAQLTIGTSYEDMREESEYKFANTLIKAEILNGDNEAFQYIRYQEPFSIKMLWKCLSSIRAAAYAVRFYDNQNRLLFALNTLDLELESVAPGLHELIVHFPINPLPPGAYYVTLGCYIRPHSIIQEIENCLKVVVENIPYRSGKLFNVIGNPIVTIPAEWRVCNVQEA